MLRQRVIRLCHHASTTRQKVSRARRDRQDEQPTTSTDKLKNSLYRTRNPRPHHHFLHLGVRIHPTPVVSHHHHRMDIPSPAKFGHRQQGLSGMPTLTPLPPFSAGSVSDCLLRLWKPRSHFHHVPPLIDNGDFDLSGSLGPQTPGSFMDGSDSLPMITDSFDQYLNPQLWADEVQAPMSLGFSEGELPILMANDRQ